MCPRACRRLRRRLVVFGAKTSEVLAGFPADLFVILVGVTYLFAIAKRNGTVDWLGGESVDNSAIRDCALAE